VFLRVSKEPAGLQRKRATRIASVIFTDCDNLMVSKGLPLVKQQNYIGTLLKQGFLHSGARCVMALTTQTRQGELRQGQGQGIGRSLG